MQFENESVMTVTAESAATPSNVAPPVAAPVFMFMVPLHNPLVISVAAVPFAVSDSVAPFATLTFRPDLTGKESVDVTGPGGAAEPPPPPPPHPAVATKNATMKERAMSRFIKSSPVSMAVCTGRQRANC